jgi:hypothetical protein
MPHVRALAQQQRPLLVVAMIVAAAIATLAIWPRNSTTATFDPRCEAWDDAASAALAFLIQERDAVTEAFLGDALFRLRRARKNCRYGFVPLARFDYDALLGDRYKFGR